MGRVPNVLCVTCKPVDYSIIWLFKSLPLLFEINSKISTYEKTSSFSKLFHSDGHTEWDNNSLGCMFILIEYDIRQVCSSCSQHGLRA